MNNIQFISSEYWDKTTMEPADRPTPEQWAIVDDICNTLNQRYYHDVACTVHPYKVQKLSVSLRNGVLSILLAPDDTCRCREAIELLDKIANKEIELYNQANTNP